MNFGPYHIIRRIAVGGMSEVFLAKHTGIEGLERRVVIKRIRQSLSKDEEFRTMFLDEARLMAALSHPNIAQVFDLGQMEESYHLVMEYVRGPTLNTLLHAASKRGPDGFPLGIALSVGIGIAEALAYVHTRRDELGRPLRIVHRDLKPANIIVSYDGAVKLIDFGIAKAASKVYETRTGVIKGTYGYIAPEQLARGTPVDHRVDVFAMGVILYEMCVGVHPFDISEEPNLLERILNARYVRPRQASSRIPKSLDKLITRCLAPHPEGRPEDMHVLVGLLAEEQLRLGAVNSMADISELVRKLVQDSDGPSPVKSLSDSTHAPFELAPSGSLHGTSLTPPKPHLLEATDAIHDRTQRIAAQNLAAHASVGTPHEASVSSWDEAQTMVAGASFDGKTAVVNDVDWSAPETQQISIRRRSTWMALSLGAVLFGIGSLAALASWSSSRSKETSPSSALPVARPTQMPSSALSPSIGASTGRLLYLSSEPSGASVTVNGATLKEVTPTTTVPKKGTAVQLRFSKDGYEPLEIEIPAGYNGPIGPVRLKPSASTSEPSVTAPSLNGLPKGEIPSEPSRSPHRPRRKKKR